MSKQEVTRFVGKPTRRVYDGSFTNGTRETWYYDTRERGTLKPDPRRVRFRDGRVVSVEKDTERLAELRTRPIVAANSSMAPIPPDVGVACATATQCQSGRCVDGKCAGPRDCVRGFGAPCSTSLDCCSERCSPAARTCY